MSDEVALLANQCLAGDQSAMRQLVDRFRGQVFGVCFRMLRHRQDAEDMTQEALVRALRNLRSWDQSRDFKPWLLAIAGNRCRTLLSSRSKRPVASPLVDQVPDRTADLQKANHLAEEMRLALGGLRPQYKQAFLLFHEQELSYAAIAEAMGCPVGTVKTWVHRARQELIEQLRARQVLTTHGGRGAEPEMLASRYT